jgi:hypothetical protein
MSSEPQTTSLQSHTFETLCSELVSGRSIVVDDAGGLFAFTDIETRALFDWYRTNRSKWAGNVMKKDVEILVDTLQKAPPTFAVASVGRLSVGRKEIHISKLRAHNFAGLHRPSAFGHPNVVFEHEFRTKLTVVEGKNGSGKTSIQSALLWALTGQIFRSQRPPEDVVDWISIDVDGKGTESTSENISSITPIPPSATENIPIDTWVELTFSDEHGNSLGICRRSISRTSRGKLDVSKPDFSFLGLDPIALEVGTKMPGLISYIKLDQRSDLGEGVATLTGIQPMADIAAHANKAREKLAKEMLTEREEELSKQRGLYRTTLNELRQLYSENSLIKQSTAIPEFSLSDESGQALEDAKGEIARAQATSLERAKAILGDSFDAKDAEQRKDLRDMVGAAMLRIDLSAVAKLATAQRLERLKDLSVDNTRHALDAIDRLVTEAQELDALAKNPRVAERLQLYARIGDWMRLAKHTHPSIEECPVCSEILAGKVDPETKQGIAEHLGEFQTDNKKHIALGLEAWAADAIKNLKADLDKTLLLEIELDLPSSPFDLVKTLLTVDLFDYVAFKKSLFPLQKNCVDLCELHVGKRAVDLPETVCPELPVSLGAIREDIQKLFRRLYRAIAYSDWLKTNCEEIARVQIAILGKVSRPEGPASELAEFSDRSTLHERLIYLRRLVEEEAPLSTSGEYVNKLIGFRNAGKEIQLRIDLYAKAARALQQVASVDALVKKQVSMLMATLGGETQYWREKLYSAAYVGGPIFHKVDVDRKGVLSIYSDAGGAKVSAHHVSNASDLRATLFAFVIAFWRYLKERNGVLSAFQLDDIQELFDPDNRHRVASVVPEIVALGGSVVVTTNDPSFSRNILSAARKGGKGIEVDRRVLHALHEYQRCLKLGICEEYVEECRRKFEDPLNTNNDQLARNYLNSLRMYLEGRIWDLFDGRHSTIDEKAGFGELFSELRVFRRSGIKLFEGTTFERLLGDKALQPGTDFVALMNKSHHKNAEGVSYKDVLAASDDCDRVKKLVDHAYDDYYLWLRRGDLLSDAKKPDMPAAMKIPKINAPILMSLAAFSGGEAFTESIDSGEMLTGEFFGNFASFYIKTRNFGFAGAGKYRALVSLDETRQVNDNDLVVALLDEKIYARRLLSSTSVSSMFVLGSEAENPLERLKTVFAEAPRTRLLPVVGLIFDEDRNFLKNGDEATWEEGMPILDRVTLAFKVKGDSALPFALPNQTVLGGELILPAALEANKGHIVAIATSDGAFLKRIGNAFPKMPSVRTFESVGARGDSVVVNTEETEGAPQQLPTMLSCRRILGVLY